LVAVSVTFQVAEGALVDKADKAKKFENRILERRSGEQQLVLVGQRQFDLSISRPFAS
jgi:hypothetical protein